ncbi:PAS domain S-box protein [Natronolimnohabitans sp. A-GB9]|uniref:PAS domain S-box protein n=1 Tax=Natronolimnohabitans sp. A-GB9 TaxID=3069757 RepID=UPI0027ADFF30|nr:PAS domain S-box protein [Natronolimnohabitans sp. A-GB9]MDQ2052062.1 PAS domain S-box protein [Natronolimnohabitans sp. A-GB9]
MGSGPPSTPSSSDPGSHDGSSSHGIGSLLSAADIASFCMRTDGTITDVNDAFTSLVGYGRSELLETDISALLASEAPSLEAAVADAESGPVSTSVSIRTRAETQLPADVHLDTIGTDGTEPRIVGLVDRRPPSTEAVEASDLTYGRTFQALADALPDGIIVLDSDSDIKYANPAVERILGYTPDELVGSSKVTIIPPRLRQAHLDSLQRYLETGERNLNWTYVELPGQHKAGHEVPLGVSLNDFVHDGERYFVGLFRDITPRKEAERTLTAKVSQLESVAYLGRRALENPAPDDLLEKATDLLAAALNVDCCAVYETTTPDVPGDAGANETAFRVRSAVGCGDDLLEYETQRSTTADSVSLADATLESDDPLVVEDLETDARFSTSNGLADCDIRSGMGVTIGPLDDPWGVLLVYDDERREFADHDVDFLESIATIIATALERQRYERRLNETVDELEASNERLEQFAYAASHDLQEPLRMVSSYLSLIERRYIDDLDSDAEEFIAYAVDGADRMREMIDGLLEYSRVETQGEPFEPVDLEAVLEDVRTDLQVVIEDSDAEITSESLPTVWGDSRQLRQLFQNLLSNAIEYSGDEPPQVHVEAERDGRMWRVSIHDAGIGIDPDDADRVFQVFERLHGREEYDGTGIGLALSRRIVERHGGEIWVDAEPGEGSTFSFTLPWARASVGGDDGDGNT